MSSELSEQEFWGALAAMSDPVPVFYRLYYNNDGTLICYSMEDLPGNYIDIDQETYIRSPGNIKVVAGKLIEISPASMVTKLHPGPVGTPCCPGDVCIVVAESAPHIKWSKQTNEIN